METKPSLTKYRSSRLKCPMLKDYVKDFNKICSPDLAHVDKLSNNNCNVKYLLVAIDCLSRYLRVKSMKTKHATETAEALKERSKPAIRKGVG